MNTRVISLLFVSPPLRAREVPPIGGEFLNRRRKEHWFKYRFYSNTVNVNLTNNNGEHKSSMLVM